MRLSDRMMLGATLIRHVSHVSSDGEGCAIQCACAATGSMADLDWIHSEPASCPVPECERGRQGLTVGVAIVHLNDDHKWNIERIADFVRSVEPAPETPAEVKESATVAERVCS